MEKPVYKPTLLSRLCDKLPLSVLGTWPFSNLYDYFVMRGLYAYDEQYRLYLDENPIAREKDAITMNNIKRRVREKIQQEKDAKAAQSNTKA